MRAETTASRDSPVGDDLIPDAEMVFDRGRWLPAPADAVWPWLVQLGKHRAGWYLPRSLERFIPERNRAWRTLNPRWQQLSVGDVVDDYGGKHDTLTVVHLDRPRALVFRAERLGTYFTWALLLTPVRGGTELRLRFRGRLRSTGWRRRVVVTAADLVDQLTTRPMLAGLAERVV